MIPTGVQAVTAFVPAGTTPPPALDIVSILQTVADGLLAGLMQLSPMVLAIPAGMFALELSWKLFQHLTAESRSEKAVMARWENSNKLYDAGCYGQSRAEARAATRMQRKHDERFK